AEQLPKDRDWPKEHINPENVRSSRRELLKDIVRLADFSINAIRVGDDKGAGTQGVFWRLKLGGDFWSLPVGEIIRGEPKGTTILIGDGGKTALAGEAERLLAAGHRVLAVDLFYFGECKIKQKDWLFALLVATVGDRPLGIQAGELAALARWAEKEFRQAPAV